MHFSFVQYCYSMIQQKWNKVLAVNIILKPKSLPRELLEWIELPIKREWSSLEISRQQKGTKPWSFSYLIYPLKTGLKFYQWQRYLGHLMLLQDKLGFHRMCGLCRVSTGSKFDHSKDEEKNSPQDIFCLLGVMFQRNKHKAKSEGAIYPDHCRPTSILSCLEMVTFEPTINFVDTSSRILFFGKNCSSE